MNKRTGLLSTAEMRVAIELVQRGGSDSEIGARLGLAENTVKSHMRRIRARVGGRDRAHLVLVLLRRGIVAAPDIPETPPPAAALPAPRVGFWVDTEVAQRWLPRSGGQGWAGPAVEVNRDMLLGAVARRLAS